MELAVHTILYIRQIYPISLFEQRTVYELPTYQCANDAVRLYIRKAMYALGEEIIAVSSSIPSQADHKKILKCRRTRIVERIQLHPHYSSRGDAIGKVHLHFQRHSEDPYRKRRSI